MKYLFSLLITFNCFAAGWFPVGKEGANTVYVEQSNCTESEKAECFDIEFCPVDECILIDEVDDLGIYTGKKLLRHSPVRKAAKEAKEQAEKDVEIEKHNKKNLIREKLKNLKKSDYSSNAKTVDLLLEVIELIK